MRSTLVFIIACTTCQISVSTPSIASEDILCTMQENISENSKNQQRRIALTAEAFHLVEDCSHNNNHSHDVLVESQVLDWWILHTPSEDIKKITILAQKNRELIQARLPSKKTVTHASTFNFWGIDLPGLVMVADHLCPLKYRIDGNTNIRFAASQAHGDVKATFCLGLPVILAANGIALSKDGDYIVVSVPNSVFNRTR